jgi:polar amino acid transport system permease protein
LTTLELSAVAFIASLPLGLGGALARTSRHGILRLSVNGYVEVIRNVPLLVIIYIVFYGLSGLGLRLDSFTSGAIALIINGTAFVTEIFRGGLAAIPQGQYDAGYSLGMRPAEVLRHVVIPQLVRVTFPALGNQVVFVILGSTLVYVIGGLELMGVAYQVGSLTFRYFEVFALASILYVLAVQILLPAWNFVGGRWLAAAPTRDVDARW